MSDQLTELTKLLVEFRDARDWKQFHSLKNLIISLQIEGTELLELTQWKTDEQCESIVSTSKQQQMRLGRLAEPVYVKSNRITGNG